MLINIINIFTIIFISIFWVVGGFKHRFLRIIFVPLFLGFSIALKGHPWLGLAVLFLAQSVRIGYGNYEKNEKNSLIGELTKDSQGAIVRLIWGVIVSLCLSIALIHKPIFIPIYVTCNAAIGYCVSKFRLAVIPTDILVALGLSSILLI